MVVTKLIDVFYLRRPQEGGGRVDKNRHGLRTGISKMKHEHGILFDVAV